MRGYCLATSLLLARSLYIYYIPSVALDFFARPFEAFKG
jgi:hypothetical protein